MGLCKYTTVVQVLITFYYKDNLGVDPDFLFKNTPELAKDLFPIEELPYTTRGALFTKKCMKETHRLTWDIVGDLNLSMDESMKYRSHLEMLEGHFGKVLNKHFGHLDVELAVYECGHNEPIMRIVNEETN
jgi:hypothetical protein